MSNKKFSKPPLTFLEKEKKAEEFLNFVTSRDSKVQPAALVTEEKKQERITQKEPVKALALRFPVSLAMDIEEISAMTGFSMNAICIELLRPAAKQKLKQLKTGE